MTIDFEEFAALQSDASEGAFRRALAFVETTFGAPYFRSRGDAIRGLVAFARTASRRAEIIEALCVGLEKALWRGERRSESTPGTDSNFIGVAAAAVALGRLRATEVVDTLRRALEAAGHTKKHEVHYELATAAAPVAVALAVLDARSSELVEPVAHFAAATWSATDGFVGQLRYAEWYARRDADAALAWLEDASSGDAGVWAAAAIADLGAIALRPRLEALLPSLAGASRIAVEHAISRLGSPSGELMIWELPLWHDNEPAGEFPQLYTSILGPAPDDGEEGD